MSSTKSAAAGLRRWIPLDIVRLRKSWRLWVIMALPLAWLLVFHYVPMYGMQIGFRDYMVTRGIAGSPWVGLQNFVRFFKSYTFWRVISNTIGLSLYDIAVGFPFPIVLALVLNQVRGQRLKKTVQMVTYAPHFISTVVMVSMIMQLLNPRIGLLPVVLRSLGSNVGNIMGKAELFKSIYVSSEVWQHTGYGSIIYLAALSSIDPTLHEAAIVDGASRLRRIWHIDIPGILPTAIIMLILRTGRVMTVGFEKVYLLQNPLNLRAAEVISTYVYKVGLIQGDYSFSTAVDFFNSVINMVLLLLVNYLARRIGQASLW